MNFEEVKQILIDDEQVCGVKLQNGDEIHSNVILSNATPKVTFIDLIAKV
jgi:phytoene dehydrogenase-like protein